jgi:two-component system cell cycle sensor histidine kinase/response regulator CckA
VVAPLSVLIVEDEPVVAMDLEVQLQGMGYRVVGQMARGEDAVSEAPQLHPSLVLMDIRLEGRMDGIEAAARIRQAIDVPIVFLTAHSDDETFGRARVTEPAAYLLKPFDRRSLKAAIDLGLLHHQAQAKLRLMERWLTSTLRSMGDGVVTTDLDGRVRSLNEVGARVTGWIPADAEGRDFGDVLPLVDGQGRPLPNPILRVLAEGVVLGLSPDTCLVARDGRLVPLQDSAAPIRDELGRITGAVIVFRDATDQLRVQERLTKVEDELHHSQKMEAVGLLAGGVAHDFNNLMTVVLGYAEMLRLSETLSTNAMEQLAAIQYAAERASDLTRQLLAFGRRQVLNPEVLDLNAVLSDIAGMLARVIGENIILEVSPADGLQAVKADRGQLEQVILNLATNARDAMPEGGRLSLRTANVVVDDLLIGGQPAPTPGSYVVLEVSDNGCGMDEATRSRIFEPFYTTKGPGKGTGLGLSTVYGIVEQSGGAVHVYSEPREGTTFRIYLPALDGATHPTAQGAADEATPGGSETILVVEDNEGVRDLVRHSLEHLGYRTLVCANGLEALEQLDAGARMDLMIVDLIMPHVSGLELADRVRQRRPQERILFMSGYAEDHLMAGRLSLPLPFIRKPFTLRQLAMGVRQALDEPVE